MSSDVQAAPGAGRAETELRPDLLALEPWAIEEAMRYFEERILLEKNCQGDKLHDQRADICAAQFRSLIENWHPQSVDFWRHVVEFNRQWSPGYQEKQNAASPRARPLSTGRLTNYLTRLSGSVAPLGAGAELDLCTTEEKYFPPEVFSTAQRFGIRLSDIRVTCNSVFQACQQWTGLEWGTEDAADPCPWPVPADLDGLRCCWKQLASASGHQRIYLNPPWSKLDPWLYKAVCECRKGVSILAVVPAWLKSVCTDIKQFASILDASHREQPACQLDIQSKVLWDAEFAHPTTGSKMPPLDVMLIWLRCVD
jgi:hypothetical protein